MKDDGTTLQLDEAMGPQDQMPVGGPLSAEDGDSIGDFCIVRTLFESSSCVIYKAEQKRSKRSVAIKVLHNCPALDSNQIERSKDQVDRLQHLRHPGIAPFIEAGTTEDGHRYFVSEFAKGMPILEYVKMHKISTKNRLEIFLRVCDALNHAHAHCLLHRDMSPSKILVDGKGNPKIVGLGIASLTNLDVNFPQESWNQDDLRRHLTYKGPEQASRKLFAIDIRSDVYSLGVILYELLTNRLPYEITGANEKEIIRIICKEWPNKPSSLRLSIRADLESIMLKALHKEAPARYQNVTGLAEDLRNYSEKRPVSARAPGALYEFGKLSSRYKSRFMSGAVMSTALVLFASHIHVTTRNADKLLLAEQEARSSARIFQLESIQKITAQRQGTIVQEAVEDMEGKQIEAQARIAQLQAELAGARNDARRLGGRVEAAGIETQNAKEIGKFLVGLLQGADGSEQGNRNLSVEQLLDRGSKQISSTFEGQPGARATLLSGFGVAYQNLGKHQKAAILLQGAAEVHDQTGEAANETTLKVMNDLASSLFSERKFEQAESVCRSVVENAAKLYGDGHTKTLTAMNNLAMTLFALKRLPEAESILRQTIEGRRNVLGSNDRRTAMSIYNLGLILTDQSKDEDAEAPLREALTILPDKLPEDHWIPANIRSRLGGCLARLERFAEAEPLLIKSYGQLKSRLGEEHPRTLEALDRIVSAYNAWGKENEAQEWLAKVPAHRRGLGNN